MALNLTGSHFASLCYLACHKPEEFDTYLEHFVDGRRMPIPKERVAAIQHGQRNERCTVQRLKEKHGLTVYPQYKTKYVKGVCVFDRTVGAKSDGLYKRTHDDGRREYGILEIKSPAHQVHETIPAYYFAQMILEMKACNRRNALFVSHLNVEGQPETLRVMHIEWDDAMWRQCTVLFERLNLWTAGSSTDTLRAAFQRFEQWAIQYIKSNN